jgi:hypothetical protein
LQVDRWTSTRVPTFGYQFNDDSAPQRYAPPGALPRVGDRRVDEIKERNRTQQKQRQLAATGREKRWRLD